MCGVGCRFLPPDTEPVLAFSVTVAKRYEPVEIFVLTEGRIIYFFVQVRSAPTHTHRVTHWRQQMGYRSFAKL